MKKIRFLIISLIALFAFGFAGCVQNVSQDKEEESSSTEYGNASVKMFIPDYYALAASVSNSSRAIAPQTTYVQLSAYNSTSGNWDVLEKIALDDCEKTAVENTPQGFSGSVYTILFKKVVVKSYAKGTLKVSLLNTSGSAITSGTNASAVTVKKSSSSEEVAQTTFFTLPETNTGTESSLAAGEMKFTQFNFKAGTRYTLYLDVTGKSYPDIAVFDENGVFTEYHSVSSAEDSQIVFEASDEACIKYIGVWADEGTYVSKYKLSLYTDLTDFEFKDSSIGFWSGENYQIKLTPIPSDAYLGTPVYSSDNEKITVSSDGVITGTEECEGTVTVTCGDISHTIAVNIYTEGTELNGALSGEKLTWTKENSPYKVTGNVLVEEGAELVIEPGVKVYFTGNYYIKMNGSINAVGTSDEPILFTTTASYSGLWDGLRIGGGSMSASDYTYLSGNIIKNAEFMHAITPLTLSNSTYVDHCKFTDCSNYVYVNSASVIISSVLEQGVECHAANSKIINNYIKKNFYLSWSWVTAKNNTVEDAYIKLQYYDISLMNTRFIGGTWSLQNDLTRYKINNNNFEDYSGVILNVTESHDSYSKVDFTGNYWGEKQTAELTANETTGEKNVSFISDYRDNFEYTEVDYSGWLKEPVENAGYLGDGFIAFDVSVENISSSTGGETQETDLTLCVPVYYSQNSVTQMRAAQSISELKETAWSSYSSSFSFTVDKEKLVNGYATIYVQLKDSEENTSSSIVTKLPYDSPIITCSIKDGSVYENPTVNLSYTFSLTDAGGIGSYSIYLNDVKLESFSFTGSLSTSYTYEQSLGTKYMACGDYTLSITAQDYAGNKTTENYTFTIKRDSVDISSLEDSSWSTTTGQPLKDDRTVYLWHLDEDGAEADDSSAEISSYSSATGGLGSGSASSVYTSGSIPLDVSSNEFTVEYWVKGSQTENYPYINIEKPSSLDCYANRMILFYKNGDNDVDSRYISLSTVPADSQWHYVSVVYGKTYVAKYIDGVLASYVDGLSLTLYNNDSKLYISSYYTDAVDEIRISNAARSADEIKAYYDCAKQFCN